MRKLLPLLLLTFITNQVIGQEDLGTRLLRQPDISDTHITFSYGSDIWVADKAGGDARRITSTQAEESNPYFSPDGLWIAFTSNRNGSNDVYIVSSKGGESTRLTWHPSGSTVRGWSPDGASILFTSSRNTAPRPISKLYSISTDGGVPELLSGQWGFDGSYSGDGTKLAVDKMSRWDVEWRAYRGGQNTFTSYPIEIWL